MRRLLFSLLIILFLMPGVISAQEKKEPSKPSESKSSPMEIESKGCPMKKWVDQMMGPEKWWQKGTISQQLVQLTTAAGEILAGGNLKPEAQKQLAGVIKKIGEAFSEIASPLGSQKPEELQKQLREMQGTLDKIKLPAKGAEVLWLIALARRVDPGNFLPPGNEKPGGNAEKIKRPENRPEKGPDQTIISEAIL